MSYIIKPSKNSAWRKHLRRNLAAEVIMYGKVAINSSHAPFLVKLVSKLIGWAKRGDLYSRRLSLRYLDGRKNTMVLDKSLDSPVRLIDKLFGVLAKRYEQRNGGYTRIIRLANRQGDNSPNVIVSLV